MTDMWSGNPFVGNVALPLPIPFDVARSYDYHIFFEGMLENNGEFDQNCCYDDFFGFVGLTDVPNEYKRPFIVPLPEDYGRAKDLMAFVAGRKYLVYHLTPANKNRCYPPEQGFQFIRMFLDSYPDWRVLIVGKNSFDFLSELPWSMMDDKRILNAINKTGSFRDMIPVLERASLLVAPDSSIMHLAACFPSLPVISLWGLFHPHDRVTYYPNHYALSKFDVCGVAPCHNHEFNLPINDCKKAVNWTASLEYCAALAAITPDDILGKAKEILNT
jgi:ADP-heptose:LPS heptosyltransferase